jgi:hypothetical protein
VGRKKRGKIMSCVKPLKAYKSLTRKTKNGKAFIAFTPDKAGMNYELLELPCGQCIACRIARSKDWAIRCVNEASMFNYNCFITLTYNDESLPENGSLNKTDFRLFMKRFRKKYEGKEYVSKNGKLLKPIRYFHCGEYGDGFDRPHHHACIFNYDFDDKVLWSIRDGNRLHTSEDLERLWSVKVEEENIDNYNKENIWKNSKGNYYRKLGYCVIGEVTAQSAAYVARYITKKFNGELSEFYYSKLDIETGELKKIVPEYISMSNRPGIGRRFCDKHKAQIYSKDYLTDKGKKFKPPKYYDKVFDITNHEDLETLKKIRRLRATENYKDYLPKRLKSKETILKQKLKNKIRSYENGSKNILSL